MHEKYSPYLIIKINESIIFVWYIMAYANYIDETIIISEIRWNECITGKDKNSDCL